jgi:hypothetical protein
MECTWPCIFKICEWCKKPKVGNTDEINPFGNQSSNHNIWPVFIWMYNFRSWLCMKKYIHMVMLIQKLKQLRNDIDVYPFPPLPLGSVSICFIFVYVSWRNYSTISARTMIRTLTALHAWASVVIIRSLLDLSPSTGRTCHNDDGSSFIVDGCGDGDRGASPHPSALQSSNSGRPLLRRRLAEMSPYSSPNRGRRRVPRRVLRRGG